jgi:hypothetical protein
MASQLDRTGESRPGVLKGHTTGELGPSDTSDTGSDVAGGPGLGDLEPLDLDHGTTEDPDLHGGTAGADVGDAGLDGDSDSSGTGENVAAGRDPLAINRDIAPDRIIDDLSELALDEDEAPGAGTSLVPQSADPAGGPEDVPTIDNPPPAQGGSDVPVADRDEGTLPHSRIDGTKQI